MEEILEQKKERVILVGVCLGEPREAEESLEELEELTRTAGALVEGCILQAREQVHPGTYVGKGKIEEIRDLLFETEADGIVCDDELSPAQLAALAALTGQFSTVFPA